MRKPSRAGYRREGKTRWGTSEGGGRIGGTGARKRGLNPSLHWGTGQKDKRKKTHEEKKKSKTNFYGRLDSKCLVTNEEKGE